MTRIRLEVCGTGLHFDRDYGIDKRTGWSAVYRGSFAKPDLCSLPRAVWLLLGLWWREVWA